SVVHTGGFFLHVSGLSDVFRDGEAQIAVLVTFGEAVEEPSFARYHNTLVLAQTPPDDEAVAAGVVLPGGDALQAYRPNLPAGAAGFRISWPSPPTDPGLDGSSTDEDKERFLEALYNILQYRVEALDHPSRAEDLADLLPTNWSLPGGGSLPDDVDLDGNPLDGSPRNGDPPWRFRQSLPVARLMGEANRYAAVGTTATFAVRVLDVFGNELPGIHRVDATVLYNDPLVPVNEWQGVSATYTVAADEGDRALLHVVLRYTPSPAFTGEDPDARRLAITDALTRYRLVRDQLSDPVAGAAVETVLAPAPLTTTVDGTSLDAALVAWVKRVIEYLEELLDGGKPPVPEPVTRTFELRLSAVAELPRDVFELSLALKLFRDADRVDPDVRKRLPAVQRVTSPLVPLIDLESELASEASDSGDDSTLRAFAEAFERAYAGFGGTGTLLKLAEGAEASTRLRTAETRQLWAVRWGQGAGLQVTVPNAGSEPPPDGLPLYLAPAPLSTQLLTRQVEVRLFGGGAGAQEVKDELRTFADVDMDVWGRAFLLAVHDVFEGEMATAVATLDGAAFGRLTGHKETLANAIQNDLEPVLRVPGQDPDPGVARERFRQALLTALPSDYGLSAVVQVPAEVAAARTTDPEIPPALYGEVAPPETKDTQAFSLSPAKLPTRRGRGRLPYLVSTRNPADRAFLELRPAFEVGFMEHDFRPEQARFGYVPSSWIGYVAPLFAPEGESSPLSMDLGPTDVPVPLRFYPPSPVLEDQQTRVARKPKTVAEALRWEYGVSVTEPGSAQDRLTLRVTFNEPLPGEGDGEIRSVAARAPAAEGEDPPRSEPRDLFEALARFTFEYPQIRPDLEKVPAAAFEGEDVLAAKKALSRFETLVKGAAETWKSWRNPALPAEREKARGLAEAAANPDLPRQSWVYAVDFQERPDLCVTRSIEGSCDVPPWPTIPGYATPPDQGQRTDVYEPEPEPGGAGADPEPGGRLRFRWTDLFLLA
ncbi:MAG: hypothetical protein ACOC7L_03025, partial [Acidobacteriota bacterium]